MLLLFAVTLFVSATMLFLVQPMVGKMILPLLGGTPAVWNTCMVFFQAVLLIGYAYTHTLSTWQDRRRQIAVQCGLLLLPFLVLPFSIGAWTPPLDTNPIFSVLGLLIVLVGLPFFVVSTSAPLLQRWFSSTDHPAAKDPYFLYGASNLGSILALLAYPVLVEPMLAIENQALVWTFGYGILVLLVLGCAYVVWSRSPALAPHMETPATTPESRPDPGAITAKPRARRSFAVAKAAVPIDVAVTSKMHGSESPLTASRRLRWVLLAAVPTSLMLGTTTFLTTDIAAIPFFWVVPLALYLLTFILVFARWPVVWTERPHDAVVYVQPLALMLVVALQIAALTVSLPYILAAHCAAFFFTTLVCHGELARDRPGPTHLTEFYLWLSVGGVLGGLFNALLAPMIFRTGSIEYPLAMIAACLLRPSLVGRDTLFPGDSNSDEPTRLGKVLDFLLPICVGFTLFVLLRFTESETSRRIYLLGCLLAVLAFLCRPLRLGLGVAGLFLATAALEWQRSPYLFQDRGFFGFVKVRKEEVHYQNKEGEISKTDVYHTLVHGGINHGMQSMDPKRRRDPITYFHPTSGIGQVFQQFKWPDARLPASMVTLGENPFAALVNLQSEPAYAVVGLGIGTLASHARPLQPLDIYEIDPLIRRLSEPGYRGGDASTPSSNDPNSGSEPASESDEPLFWYVKDAKDRHARVRILMGDGRLVLNRQDRLEHFYHIIVLDAFSSDAIPVHLLTREAIEIYLKKLASGGVLIFNATNRYVDIRDVLADLADELDMTCTYFGNSSGDYPEKFASDWVILQRKKFGQDQEGRAVPYNGSPPLENRLPREAGWEYLQRNPARRLWTDRYSNLLSVVTW